MILNPGSEHFNFANGAAVLDYTDYPTPGTNIDTLSNNPGPIVS